MRCLTLHTAACIYIYFWKWVLSNHDGPAAATRGCGRASRVFSKPISMLVFHILRVPSEGIHICSACTAATGIPLDTGLIWIQRESPYAGPNFPVLLTIQLFKWCVFFNPPECVLGTVWTATLTRRSRCTPCLNQLFIFYLRVLWNILSCFFIFELQKRFVILTWFIAVPTALCSRHVYVPRIVSRKQVRVTRLALRWRQCLCDMMSFHSSLSIAIGVNP